MSRGPDLGGIQGDQPRDNGPLFNPSGSRAGSFDSTRTSKQSTNDDHAVEIPALEGTSALLGTASSAGAGETMCGAFMHAIFIGYLERRSKVKWRNEAL
jgi:hypothetical protein